MKRVASELDAMNEPEKEPNREFLVLQGVRFAFRVHQVHFISILHLKNLIVFENIRSVGDILNVICFQFAGGFDAESMKAFEELRSRVRTTQTGDDNKQEA